MLIRYFIFFGIILFHQSVFTKEVHFLDTYVPGCASESSLNFEELSRQNISLESVNHLPSCFCENGTKDDRSETKFIKVVCYYSTTFENLTSTLQLVQKSGKKIEELYLSNIEYTEEGIPDGYFEKFGTKPKKLSIVVCNGNDRFLKLTNGSFRGMEESLQRLKIDSCFLNTFPEALRRLENLEELSLQSTFIQTLQQIDMAPFRKLKTLYFGYNQMYYVEPGSFDGLKSLTYLKLSPDNAFNHTIFEEVNKIPSLTKLDLSQNSIKRIPNEAMKNLKNLKFLDLTANLIYRLERDSFSGLEKLENLILTGNQLNYTEFNTFNKEMKNLTELSLAINKLTELDSKTFWNLENLEILDLSYNRLTLLPATLLGKNSKLQYLNLTQNRDLNLIEDKALFGAKSLLELNLTKTSIENITDATLVGLESLKVLDLSDSFLNSIGPKAFKDCNQLIYLNLRDAALMQIPSQLLDPIENKLKFLDLSSNRWRCTPENNFLIKFVHKNSGNSSSFLTNSVETRCWMPLEFRDLSLLEINPETMQPYVQPTLQTLNFGPNNNNPFDFGTTQFNLFANFTFPPFDDHQQPDLDKFGYGTLAPKKEIVESSVNPKTLIVSLVLSAVAVTIIVVVFVVFIMKKRRRAKMTTDVQSQGSSTNNKEKDFAGPSGIIIDENVEKIPTKIEMNSSPTIIADSKIINETSQHKDGIKSDNEDEHEVQL